MAEGHVESSIRRPVERRMDHIKVAAVQTLVPEGDDAVAATAGLLARAGREGVDLIVFPEYHLGHVTEGGPEIAAVGAACAAANVNAVVGAWLDRPGKPSLNAALVFDRTGALLGHYDKMHAAIGSDPHSWPPHGHEEEWHMEPGAGAGPGTGLFDMDFGRLGVMTCYDGYFPESSHCLSLEGAEVIAWINGRYGAIEDYLVRGYCFTGFVHMVAANQSTGAGTQIAAFPGKILEISTEPRKDYFLTGELDLAMLREYRVNARMFHQRRPEAYGALTRHHPVWLDYPDLKQPPLLPDLLAARDREAAAAK